jgi:hypothetical protein
MYISAAHVPAMIEPGRDPAIEGEAAKMLKNNH